MVLKGRQEEVWDWNPRASSALFKLQVLPRKLKGVSVYENEKREKMLELAAALESMDQVVEIAQSIKNLEFEDISRKHWDQVKKFAVSMEQFFEMMKETSSNALKMLDNPALYDHFRAVMDSED